MPTLSIIIPVYNAEQYLEQCLQSIVSQDCDDMELLLIDDGSTDQSAVICRQYAERYGYIRYYHQQNGGVSSARNLGLEQATGHYISFVDADDWVEPIYAATLIKHITSGPAYDIIFFGEHLVNKNQCETLTPQTVDCQGREAVEQCIYTLRYGGSRDIFGWTWDKVFRADIIRQHRIKFHEEVTFREDELFTFEFCRYISTLLVISIPLYNYRITETGLTSKNMGASDFLPSSIALEESLAFYQHEGIREHMLHSITSYRALHLFKKAKLGRLKQELRAYQQLTERQPQPGKDCPIQHLTQYLHKGFWAAYLYCLIRKL